jgi:hypothetical protein
MNSGITITVNLLGSFGEAVKHTTTQSHTAELSSRDGKRMYVNSTILHTDRPRTKCVKQTVIHPNVVASWKKSECPFWESPKDWKKYNPAQKIASFVNRFDEGYGVSYE